MHTGQGSGPWQSGGVAAPGVCGKHPGLGCHGSCDPTVMRVHGGVMGFMTESPSTEELASFSTGGAQDQAFPAPAIRDDEI